MKEVNMNEKYLQLPHSEHCYYTREKEGCKAFSFFSGKKYIASKRISLISGKCKMYFQLACTNMCTHTYTQNSNHQVIQRDLKRENYIHRLLRIFKECKGLINFLTSTHLM